MLWVAVVFLLPLLATAEQVDRGLGIPPDPILAPLEGPLHERGIDLVMGQTRDLPLHAERPRLGRLEGFVIQEAIEQDSEVWRQQFVRGQETLLAVKPRSQPTDGAVFSETEFLDLWKAEASDRRVFVAYARQDREVASVVRQVLESRGYIVFTYLEADAKAPWAHPRNVGKFFAEAGHHLVIDSHDARVSEGTLFEAIRLRKASASGRAPQTPMDSSLEALLRDMKEKDACPK